MPRYASLRSAILLFLARYRPSGKIRCSGKNVTGLWLGGRLWMLRNLPGYSSGWGIIWEITPALISSLSPWSPDGLLMVQKMAINSPILIFQLLDLMMGNSKRERY